jgi:hypothetical protein
MCLAQMSRHLKTKRRNSHKCSLVTKKYEKRDSLPCFPRNAVHHDTAVVLTSRFEMDLGEPHSYGRPKHILWDLFINVCEKDY